MSADKRTGGAYQPDADYDCASGVRRSVTLTGATVVGSGATITSPAISGGTVTGATITGGTVTSTGSTLTAPTITAPVISGAMTVASGATLTTPTVRFTSASITATGTGPTDAATLSAVTPAMYAITGAASSGVNLSATGTVGSLYIFNNAVGGTVNIYSNGGFINTTTGTTAYALTSTGNKMAIAFAISSTGAWRVFGNT